MRRHVLGANFCWWRLGIELSFERNTFVQKKAPVNWRSTPNGFGGTYARSFYHRQAGWKNQGLPAAIHDGPFPSLGSLVIHGRKITPCNAPPFGDLADRSQTGIYESGWFALGVSLFFPVGESSLRPTAWCIATWRRWMWRSVAKPNPLDGVVLHWRVWQTDNQHC